MMPPALVAAVLLAALWLPCQAQQKVEYLKEEPAKGSIPHGKVVYVDDHTCPRGQVKEVTGGSEQKGIPRRVRCVKKPG